MNAVLLAWRAEVMGNVVMPVGQVTLKSENVVSVAARFVNAATRVGARGRRAWNVGSVRRVSGSNVNAAEFRCVTTRVTGVPV